MADRKIEGTEGLKLLVVQPLTSDRKPKGRVEIAADTVQAGEGDFVFLVGSREASHALEQAYVPVDSAIVGIVDDVERET